MKTTAIEITFECPNCSCCAYISTDELYAFDGGVCADHETCEDCGVEFLPAIYLNEFKEKEEVKEGCVCDLGEGETPTLCVIDDPEYGTTDCVHAASGKTKENCGYWLQGAQR